MPYDLQQVAGSLFQTVTGHTRRQVAAKVSAAQQRIGQRLAYAGRTQLKVEDLKATILDLCARVDDLEQRRGQVLEATPEEYAEHAREWKESFPGSEPPPVWESGRNWKPGRK